MTLARAIGRHPFVVILPAIVLLAAGIVVGAKKPPTYSAVATVNVGKSDIVTQATPGYVQAAEALATAYSRLVTSQYVATPAAKVLHLSPAAASSDLTAVPIPNEPTFTITATGSSPSRAAGLANAAVAALQRYVRRTASQQGGPTQLLNKYRNAQELADGLQQTSNRLSGLLAAHLGGVSQAQVTRARVASQIAALQAQALSGQYLSLASSAVAPVLSVLISPNGSTTVNRTSNIEKYGVVGGIGGFVIGIALAGLVGSVGDRRRRYVTA
jgi:capsular polysaccharide biosynthesis protein